MSVIVVNVVATADVGQRVDLRRVGMLSGVVYAPDRYACAYLKRPGMAGRVSIFGSGKLIGVGAKSIKEVRSDLRLASAFLARECGLRATRPAVQVRNIVAHLDTHVPVDLVRLAVELPEAAYDPEVFPAVVWKPTDFPGTLLVFSSGKVVAAVRKRSDLNRLEGFLSDRLGKHG
jgi:transcription initiation factor TFIID TATA-box-binding protein